jgi:hypothetical protein
LLGPQSDDGSKDEGQLQPLPFIPAAGSYPAVEVLCVTSLTRWRAASILPASTIHAAAHDGGPVFDQLAVLYGVHVEDQAGSAKPG